MPDIKIGKLFGIKILLNWSWFLIAGLIIWILYDYFKSQVPELISWQYWLMAISGAALFFGSVLFHELAHSLVAMRNGIPVESISFFIFGGVARIKRDAKSVMVEFKFSIAGPLSSLVLSGLFWAIYYFSRLYGFPQGAAVFNYLSYLNLMLAGFNMIPAFPLDGGRVLRAVLWGISKSDELATKIAAKTGAYIGWGAIIFFPINIIFLHGDVWNAIWIAFIGFLLVLFSGRSYNVFKIQKILSSKTAADAMISYEAEYFHQYNLDKEKKCQLQDDLFDILMEMDSKETGAFLVFDNGKIVGTIYRKDIEQIARDGMRKR